MQTSTSCTCYPLYQSSQCRFDGVTEEVLVTAGSASKDAWVAGLGHKC
jgi:hypothetical protein